MPIQTLMLGKKKFVVMPSTEYERLAGGMPPMPKKLVSGNYPLLEATRVGIARDIIRMRNAAGLSQAELARKSGVRVETISRLERARHMPDVATMDKISKALDRARVK